MTTVRNINLSPETHEANQDLIYDEVKTFISLSENLNSDICILTTSRRASRLQEKIKLSGKENYVTVDTDALKLIGDGKNRKKIVLICGRGVEANATADSIGKFHITSLMEHKPEFILFFSSDFCLPDASLDNLFISHSSDLVRAQFISDRTTTVLPFQCFYPTHPSSLVMQNFIKHISKQSIPANIFISKDTKPEALQEFSNLNVSIVALNELTKQHLSRIPDSIKKISLSVGNNSYISHLQNIQEVVFFDANPLQAYYFDPLFDLIQQKQNIEFHFDSSCMKDAVDDFGLTLSSYRNMLSHSDVSLGNLMEEKYRDLIDIFQRLNTLIDCSSSRMNASQHSIASQSFGGMKRALNQDDSERESKRQKVNDEAIWLHAYLLQNFAVFWSNEVSDEPGMKDKLLKDFLGILSQDEKNSLQQFCLTTLQQSIASEQSTTTTNTTTTTTTTNTAPSSGAPSTDGLFSIDFLSPPVAAEPKEPGMFAPAPQ